MAWMTNSDDDRPILEEIEKQTDRAAALIAVAYLEERLLAAIKSRLVNDGKTHDKIFRGSGPVSAFSAKIDLAFLLGIYDAKVQKMFHTVREIRNEFAHEPQPRDFKSQRISDLCENVSIIASFNIKNNTTGVEFDVQLKPDGTSKTSFMNAIKYLLLVADTEIKKIPHRVPHGPIVPSPTRLSPSEQKS
jgi:DNA-binding MltR family transcriptional regulator